MKLKSKIKYDIGHIRNLNVISYIICIQITILFGQNNINLIPPKISSQEVMAFSQNTPVVIGVSNFGCAFTSNVFKCFTVVQKELLTTAGFRGKLLLVGFNIKVDSVPNVIKPYVFEADIHHYTGSLQRKVDTFLSEIGEKKHNPGYIHGEFFLIWKGNILFDSAFNVSDTDSGVYRLNELKKVVAEIEQ